MTKNKDKKPLEPNRKNFLEGARQESSSGKTIFNKDKKKVVKNNKESGKTIFSDDEYEKIGLQDKNIIDENKAEFTSLNKTNTLNKTWKKNTHDELKNFSDYWRNVSEGSVPPIIPLSFKDYNETTGLYTQYAKAIQNLNRCAKPYHSLADYEKAKKNVEFILGQMKVMRSFSFIKTEEN